MAKVTVQSKENLRQEIIAGNHRLIADEPVSSGGDDSGPDPYSLLLGSLGVCTSMTLKLYARNKNWDLRSVRVELNHEKVHVTDCQECETKDAKLDRIERRIFLEGNLDEQQQARLREIAKRCPVHQTLTSKIMIVDL
jgi:uncharacterized OsmC-like protein